jgi:hypothetical protein
MLSARRLCQRPKGKKQPEGKKYYDGFFVFAA